MLVHCAVTKAALEHLTESWAVEFAGAGYRVVLTQFGSEIIKGCSASIFFVVLQTRIVFGDRLAWDETRRISFSDFIWNAAFGFLTLGRQHSSSIVEFGRIIRAHPDLTGYIAV
jgi:NAD(P)-dependent dehydrogenase (short-subunit alcohol dehydrogenase family)